jgi:hypothetical protein
MITRLERLLNVRGSVTLVNKQGYSINITSIATGNIGCYTDKGKFYSSTTLKVLGYRLIK